jgi:hypothetical protein
MIYIHQVFLKLTAHFNQAGFRGKLSEAHKHAHSILDKGVLPEQQMESLYPFIREAIKHILLIIEECHSYWLRTNWNTTFSYQV